MDGGISVPKFLLHEGEYFPIIHVYVSLGWAQLAHVHIMYVGHVVGSFGAELRARLEGGEATSRFLMMEDGMRCLIMNKFCVLLLLRTCTESVLNYPLVLIGLLECVWRCLLGSEVDSLN